MFPINIWRGISRLPTLKHHHRHQRLVWWQDWLMNSVSSIIGGHHFSSKSIGFQRKALGSSGSLSSVNAGHAGFCCLLVWLGAPAGRVDHIDVRFQMVWCDTWVPLTSFEGDIHHLAKQGTVINKAVIGVGCELLCLSVTLLVSLNLLTLSSVTSSVWEHPVWRHTKVRCYWCIVRCRLGLMMWKCEQQ